MKLTDKECKNAKPTSKVTRLTDDRSEFLPDRRKMMQDYADYIDSIL